MITVNANTFHANLRKVQHEVQVQQRLPKDQMLNAMKLFHYV